MVRSCVHAGRSAFFIAPLVSLCAAPALLAQTTWRVDDVPGPGVDFATIQEAVDAAVPGDVVLVGDGSYAPFFTDEGVVVIGAGIDLTRVYGDSQVQATVGGVPPGQVFVAADIRFEWLDVVQNEGVVVLDGCRIPPSPSTASHGLRAWFSASRDVRLQRCAIWGRMVQGSGWLQVAQSLAVPEASDSTPQCPPGQKVLVTNPTITGLNGYASQDTICFGGWHWYVDGRPAVLMYCGELLIAGRTGDFLRGGGPQSAPCTEAWGASGVVFRGDVVRTSRVAITTGDPSHFPQDLALGPTTAHVTPLRADPTLRLDGTPRPGAALTISLDGEPGDWARLEIGRGPVVAASPGSPVPRFVTPGRALALGAVPVSETIQVPLTVPPSARPGDVYWLQGSTVDPSGVGRRTNSLAVIVRE